jgi:FAD:protein FMN transferase
MCAIGVGLLGMEHAEPELGRYEFTQTEMAIPVTIILYGGDISIASRAAKAAFERIHELNAVMSDYDPQSELRRLCDSSSAGSGVAVSDDLWQVLVHSQDLSTRSDGAFDITVGPVVRLWRRARQMKVMPTSQVLNKALDRVGYNLIRLDSKQHKVELLKADMRLDLGGIAKGYALDQAYIALKKNGIDRALIEAGGDIRLGEPPPNKPGWRIGVAQIDAKGQPGIYLSLSRVAVATSGDTMQFVMIDGKRYSHIVDPKTGIGLTDRTQVTVIAPDGITADGLSTAVNVLGPAKGLKLIESTPNTAAYIMRQSDGKIETYISERWKALKREKDE